MGSRQKLAAASLMLAAAVMLAGCTSGGGTATTPAQGGSNTADVEGAKAAIAQYLLPPENFPLTEPLKKSAAGKKVAYLDCGTPICAQGWPQSQEAAAALGIEIERIDASMQADVVAAAFDTVIARGFDGVINKALPNALAESGMKQLKERGIPVVGAGVVNGDPNLLSAELMGNAHFERMGEILGAYVVSEFGGAADVVVYVIPELELTQIIYQGFEKTFRQFCPGCNLRTSDISVTTIGSTAPATVTDDLQAHPNTNVAVFTTAEAAIGLPVALKTAGLNDVAVVGGAPTGEALRQIQDGDMKGGLAWDFVYHSWSTLDALARLMTKQQLDPGEVSDDIPAQILTKSDVTPEMVKEGSWAAFPTSKFKALWDKAA